MTRGPIAYDLQTIPIRSKMQIELMIFALKPESVSFARIYEGFEKDRLLNAICLLSLPRIVKNNLQIDFEVFS